MEIRDPIHGSIHLLKEEIPIIEHPFFQRLRNIKQLGFSEYIFPGGTHSRFIHSLGVMNIAGRAFDLLFKKDSKRSDFLRLKETLKLGGLLHDIGHAPLSHSTEFAMPQVSELKLPKKYLFSKPHRQASHEDYTIKSIIDSSFSETFSHVRSKFGVEKETIADLIHGETDQDEYFTIDGINYFPLLHQLVSSEMDCDRMDYLLRDSFFCGVSYGNFDLDWILDNLQICEIDKKAYLGITERAIPTFNDFLLSRYHMFLMVYFHYKSVCLEQLLLKYFKTSNNEYAIPASIEKYQEHDDHNLMHILKSSKNKYAQDIVVNKIPRKIYESFTESQHEKIQKIENFLQEKNIEYILCSSSNRISKYYTNEPTSSLYPMKVARELYGTSTREYTNINESTDLYDKFQRSHSVNRLHCDIENLDTVIQKEIEELIRN